MSNSDRFVSFSRCARLLAEQEAGEHAGDPTFIWALAMKWQAVLDYLLRQRKLALLARRLDDGVETFQPTDDPQDAWVSQLDLRQIFATPPREIIEKFEGRRQEEADRSAAQQQARQAAGRYTLWDAAKAIGDATATPFERVLDALVESAIGGELTIYPAGGGVPRGLGEPMVPLWEDEATSSGLNAWLRLHAPHADFAFRGVPEGATEESAAPTIPGRRVLDFPEVCRLLGLSREGVRRRYMPASRYFDPEFPKPFRLGVASRSRLGFFEDEVKAWFERRTRQRVGRRLP